MIDKSSLNRTRGIVQKCASGTQLSASISDKVKKQFAAKNGYTFQNGQFFTVDNEGKNVAIDISDDMVSEWAGSGENIGAAAGAISTAMSAADNMFIKGNPNISNQSTQVQTANAAYDTASDVVMKINPIAGTAMKMGGFASDVMTAAGLGTDQQSVGDKILDSKFLKATPFGIVNTVFAKKSDDFSLDQATAEAAGSSYGGTIHDVMQAADKAGKKYGLLSNRARKRANRVIDEARQQQNKLTDIVDTARDQRGMADAMGDLMGNAYQFNLKGGYDQRFVRAKEGAKLPEPSKFENAIIEEVLVDEVITPTLFEDGGIITEMINPTTGQIEEFTPQLIEEWKPEIVEVDSLKTGGRIEKQLDAPEIEETTQQNIIPEGALHKNKHNMEDAEGLTKKGIPVVDEDHKQQAEIECNEIIFTKEVTTKLEELYKIFYNEESTAKEKEEAALEAGKLLTKEIMLNTDDRTGLIDTLKQGGTIPE